MKPKFLPISPKDSVGKKVHLWYHKKYEIMRRGRFASPG